MKNRGLVSIIIVNWNGKRWLKGCIDSLYEQTYKNFEIIFVDNNSTDDSVPFVQSHYSKVKIIKNKNNVGFAGGNNIGLQHAKGEYIWLLNNDTISDKNALKNLLDSFNEIENLGVVQSKLILMEDKNKLDSCGAFLTNTGYLFHYGLFGDADDPKFDKPFPVYTVKGASMLTKREVINEVGGLFDEDYFAYFEETDFCHRVWLAGYECWYYPNSITYHKMGGTSLRIDNEIVQFHSFKNKIQTYIKNLNIGYLLILLPTHILMDIVVAIFYMFVGNIKIATAIIKAFIWNVKHIHKTYIKRKNVNRKLTKIPQYLIHKPGLRYYFYILTGNINKIRSIYK